MADGIHKVYHVGNTIGCDCENVRRGVVREAGHANLHLPLVEYLAGVIPAFALDFVDLIVNPAAHEERVVVHIVSKPSLRS